MTDGPQRIEDLLLDLHLDRLDPARADELNAALSEDADLASRSHVLGEVLGRLDACEVSDPSYDLSAMVMARIDEQAAILPFRQAASAVPPGSAQDLSASPVLSLRELIAIAACITLFVGIFVPGYFKAQSIAMRNRCLDNVRQIWAGTSQFAEANAGFLPHTGYVEGGSWLPTRVPNVRRFSNTAYVYRLVKDGYVRDTRIFVCPASPHGRPMLADNYREFNDFAEPVNTTYSYLFMNVPKPLRVSDLKTGRGQLVLVADSNPLFDGRSAAQVNPYDETGDNSVAHEGASGQNAAYITGQADWFSQPTIGVDGDNIYRAGKLVRYQGTERPVCPTDTLLVP